MVYNSRWEFTDSGQGDVVSGVRLTKVCSWNPCQLRLAEASGALPGPRSWPRGTQDELETAFSSLSRARSPSLWTTSPRGLWAGGRGCGVCAKPRGAEGPVLGELGPGLSLLSLGLRRSACRGKGTRGRRSGPGASSQDADAIQSGFGVLTSYRRLGWLATRGAAVTP